MQLREIHIDGFGIFADKHITGLTPGINAIYGANEFGKSTLLAFIRRILFGFPHKSSSTNPYPALRGGAYGGKLVCEMANGERITIARQKGTHGGKVTVLKNSGETNERAELEHILGHTTETFYKNVYAVSLNELQEPESLQEEEIRNRINEAGLGLGSISLTEVNGKFREQMELLYKPGGKRQKMLSLYKEIEELGQELSGIRGNLSKYDEFQKQSGRLNKEIEKLNEQINDLRQTERSLSNKKRLYPNYFKLKSAESELSKLEEVPNFTKNALAEMERLKRDVEDSEKSIKNLTDDLRDAELERDGLIYNKQIIEQESSINTLQRLSAKYLSAANDIGGVKKEENILNKKIQGGITKIGTGWTEEAIKDFILSHSQKDKIRSYKTNLEKAQRNIEKIENKLDMRRAQLMEHSTSSVGLNLNRYAIYIMSGCGLIGTITGLSRSDWWLLGFSTIILVIGIISSIKMRGTPPKALSDPQEKKIQSELEKAKREDSNLKEDWQEFLKSINFDESLSPDGAREIITSIEGIQKDISSREQLHTRIEEMQKTISDVEKLHSNIAPSVHDSINSNIAADIEIFKQKLEEAKKIKVERVQVDTQVDQLSSRLNSAETEKGKQEQALRDYISSLGASDENDFRLKYEIFTNRIQLANEISENTKAIQPIIGKGEEYDKFISSLDSTNPEKIKFELETTSIQLDELEELRTQKNILTGSLKEQIKQMSSSDDLLTKQIEVEEKKQQLQDYARDWSKAQIALFILKKAISKYETTRQSGIIRAAGEIFSNITDGNYPTIRQTADSNELKIRDIQGNAKSVIEMSRGTREQLYLAMRLGLIQEHETKSEPLPVVMDDILVNFDDERVPWAIKALAEFSKNRQIVVLTCHKNILDIYKAAGARELKFT